MSSSAYEILPDGKCKERQAADCGEADREKTFCCLHCNVRVYLHLPMDKRKILAVKAATQHTAIHCWMEFVTAI